MAGCLLVVLFAACQSLPPPISGGAGGAVRLTSSPPKALVSIDGTVTALRTPVLVSPLPPGEHRVKLSRAGYRDWEKYLFLKPGETLEFDVRLQSTTTGTFSISSVPFQCRIFVDGRPIPQVTPATLSDLSVGTHTILLRREGYDDWSHAIVILKDRHLRIKASLKPARELTGHLRIQSYPPEASIIFDGYPTGNWTPATIFNLQAGTHQLRLMKDGFTNWEEKVIIEEGEMGDLLVNLQRLESSLWGSAAIYSTPPGAKVTLGNVPLGSPTPVVLKSLTHGSHPLRIERDGFQTWEGELIVQPQERTELTITLQPE